MHSGERPQKGAEPSGGPARRQQRRAVGEALPRIIAEHSGIEVLVNNAGYGLWGPIESVSMEQLKAQFETNFFAAARMIKAVLPQMTRRRSGTIVNISSVLGRMGTPLQRSVRRQQVRPGRAQRVNASGAVAIRCSGRPGRAPGSSAPAFMTTR